MKKKERSRVEKKTKRTKKQFIYLGLAIVVVAVGALYTGQSSRDSNKTSTEKSSSQQKKHPLKNQKYQKIIKKMTKRILRLIQ